MVGQSLTRQAGNNFTGAWLPELETSDLPGWQRGDLSRRRGTLGGGVLRYANELREPEKFFGDVPNDKPDKEMVSISPSS